MRNVVINVLYHFYKEIHFFIDMYMENKIINSRKFNLSINSSKRIKIF